jgi:hypothetical protein
MKKLGQYTARGTVSEAETEAGNPAKIPLFDGQFKTAYRITAFYIWASDWSGSTKPDCIGKLSKNDDGVTTSANFMRADDDNQIAWATTSGDTDGGVRGGFSESIIDPDNLVVEDLFVYARTASSVNTDRINYIVEMEKYEITDWQGALAMARDRAQGDL